ncbi:MAG: hypothetical protein AAFP08_07780 [Bacteroidota bacterium]
MTTIGDRLPPLSGGGLECHLNPRTQRTDLMLRLTRDDGGLQCLVDSHAYFSFTDGLLTQWPSISKFGQNWLSTNNILNETVENLWLEFDINETQPDMTKPPSVFFEVNRHKQLTLVRQLAVIEAALNCLSPKSIQFLSKVHILLSKLSENTGLDYVGSMLMRDMHGIRLCMLGFEIGQVLPFLERIEWPGNLHNVKRLLARYAVNADCLVLDLDVTESINSGIGLEVFFQHSQSWQSLLQQLSSEQRVDRRAAEAISHWPGVTKLNREPFRWALQQAQGTAIDYLIRRFNHLKFSLDAEDQMSIKAYLYFCYG